MKTREEKDAENRERILEELIPELEAEDCVGMIGCLFRKDGTFTVLTDYHWSITEVLGGLEMIKWELERTYVRAMQRYDERQHEHERREYITECNACSHQWLGSGDGPCPECNSEDCEPAESQDVGGEKADE